MIVYLHNQNKKQNYSVHDILDDADISILKNIIISHWKLEISPFEVHVYYENKELDNLDEIPKTTKNKLIQVYYEEKKREDMYIIDELYSDTAEFIEHRIGQIIVFGDDNENLLKKMEHLQHPIIHRHCMMN